MNGCQLITDEATRCVANRHGQRYLLYSDFFSIFFSYVQFPFLLILKSFITEVNLTVSLLGRYSLLVFQKSGVNHRNP